MYTIYMITNNINNKKYIGITKKTLQERYIEHISTIRKKKKYALHHALLKYGVENFSIEEIEHTNDVSRETYWINHYNTRTHGYNLTAGGDGTSGYKFDETQKKIISERVKELHKSGKIGMHGKKHSIETRQKIKDAHTKIAKYGPENHSYGRKHTDETKRKLSLANKGRKIILTEEKRAEIVEKAKIRFAGKGNPMYGRKQTENSKSMQSVKARLREKKHCNKCNKTMDISNFNRWHSKCS